MFIVDSHCHLNRLNYEKLDSSLDDVISKAEACDVKFILSVATTLSDYKSLKKFVGERKNIALSCGIHPLYQKTPYNPEELHQLGAEKQVIALGETGLDYFEQENKKKQQSLFREHIRLGIFLNKPIIIHMRNSCNDILTILREEKIDKCGGVLHCFTENKQIASKLLDLGLYISFSGIVTFRNSQQIQDAARYVPLDRLLLETDSPYLTPVPHRGKENHPAFTRDIARYIALLKGIDIESLAWMTTKNFSHLFDISMNFLDDKFNHLGFN